MASVVEGLSMEAGCTESTSSSAPGLAGLPGAAEEENLATARQAVEKLEKDGEALGGRK